MNVIAIVRAAIAICKHATVCNAVLETPGCPIVNDYPS